jgi:hypothetical protein
MSKNIKTTPYPPYKRSGTTITERNAGDNVYHTGDVTLLDDKKIRLGTGLDGEIYINADDLYVRNITPDKDIIFSGNDGGVQTEIMRLDVSEGQLSGVLKATTGVLGTATAGTDYVTPTGTETLTNKNIQRSINAQTGTAYTFVIGDAGKVVTFENANAQTITIPKNSAVAFAVGTQIDCIGLGAGVVTFAPVDGDVTIRSEDGNLAIAGQDVGVTLLKLATDKWILFGNLTA